MKNSGYIDTPRISAIEPDMRPKPYADDDAASTKVFKSMPLIGDLVISAEILEKMYNNAKKFIDRAMSSREKVTYAYWVYEQVAIVVVNFAKKWNNYEEGKFTRYIAMQFGYRDDTGKVWRIIAEALEIAFRNNDKFFIKSSNGERQFYETVMAHSFGPADAWTPMIDLLFKFYSENLDWNYVPGDPLFARLVSVLQKYFNNSITVDDKFLIASNYYYLRIGIRRLTQERPGYCAHLFEQIVHRIHQLVHNEAKEAKRYSMKMVDQWFINRISNAETIIEKRSNRTKSIEDIALDYSKISVRYILSNGLPALRIPSIRLFDEGEDDVVAQLYIGKTLVSSTILDVHGNELGETILAHTFPIPLDHWTAENMEVRMVIQVGTTEIYDSEQTLYRQLLLFSDNREINLSRVKREKYQLYAANMRKLCGTNIDTVQFANGMCEIAFHKGYALEYAGNLLAVDSADIQGVRLVKPFASDNSVFLQGGESYLITNPTASLKVYFSDDKILSKYYVQINNETSSLSNYFDAVSENRAVIPFTQFQKGDRLSISLIDLVSNTTVFNQKYIVLPEYSATFDQDYYVITNEFAQASVTVSIGDEQIIVHSQNAKEASFEYLDGRITIDIPNIQFSFFGIEKVFQEKYIRAVDLTEHAAIEVRNHTGLNCVITAGSVAFQDEATIPLKQIVDNNPNHSIPFDIVMEIANNKTLIGKVLFEDQFLVQPQIIYQENALIWDGGLSFVGDSAAKLDLLLLLDTEVQYSFPLILGSTEIAALDDFVDDVYTCRIISDNKTIAEFNSFVGDERRARFAKQTLIIRQVTEDIEHNAAPVKVKPVYIDQIKYVDTCYVDTEDDIFDVYTGCMYRKNYAGEKKYFSFKYNDAKSKYKVNPVKIIYISNRYLRIVNEDDEGIYYFYNEFASIPGNEITDIEPSSTAKGYHDILFYLYSVDKPLQHKIVPAVVSAVPSNTDNSVVEVPEITPNRDSIVAESFDDAMPQPIVDTTPDPIIDSLPENNSIEIDTAALFAELQETLQETVIAAPSNNRILVNAGPGTGKTWTLIERIISLIQNGVDPEAIQVLCFSRAAVEVVRQRMDVAISENRVDINAGKVDIRTFDSFATQLLYWVKESEYSEISSSFKIESLSYEDRILRFVDVLRAQPQLIEQCEHLIVDEVQDLVMSRAQMVIEMIKRLPTTSGVTLFGDACQAIYDYQVDRGVSSTDFYETIRKLGCFTFYSFTKNFRQISALQDYCSEYRNAILANDIDLCNKHIAKLHADLPDYTEPNISSFQENTLDQISSKGNIGILTRSNAQALMISGIFRKKNISHIVQRRLSDDALSGWIALFFNQSPIKYYNEEDFVAAFNVYCPEYMQQVDPHIVWETISDTYSATTGKLSAKNLLASMQHKGKCKGLFTEMPSSNITVSTIHRSKGREFDAVILLDSLLSSDTDQPEEHRVNYVALSRAKSRMYKVSLKNAYFKTLENRRCFSLGTSFKTNTRYLRSFEIGRKDDLVASSFAYLPDVQKYIRARGRSLVGKEVYLKKDQVFDDGNVSYLLVLKENNMVLAVTSQQFSADLCTAIRQSKNLPYYAHIYEQLFPAMFTGIYITDVASEIGMPQGHEIDIMEHENTATWNTLLLEGYAKAEY